MSEPWVLTEPPPPGIRETYGPAPSQHVWIRRPPGTERLRTLAMIHGGYWRAAYDAGHVGHLCADLVRRGWATVALEYRRIGEDGGAWPGTLTDVSAALDSLQGLAGKHRLDLDRARKAGDDIRLVMPEDADHFDVIDPKSKAWAQVVDAIGTP